MKATILLALLYVVIVLDVVFGLNLNVYGWGREPLSFSVCAVMVAIGLYAFGRFSLGMIALVLCCAWLALYPAKNGFDVVLSPTLVLGCAVWLWQKFKRKK